MDRSHSRSDVLADVLALGLIFAMFLAACKIVDRVGLSLLGGPFAWAGLAVFFSLMVLGLCMAAARGDRIWVEASRRRDSDSVSLADMDGPQSGVADRDVAPTGLGPAFSLTSGRSGRPSRRGPHR